MCTYWERIGRCLQRNSAKKFAFSEQDVGLETTTEGEPECLKRTWRTLRLTMTVPAVTFWKWVHYSLRSRLNAVEKKICVDSNIKKKGSNADKQHKITTNRPCIEIMQRRFILL